LAERGLFARYQRSSESAARQVLANGNLSVFDILFSFVFRQYNIHSFLLLFIHHCMFCFLQIKDSDRKFVCDFSNGQNVIGYLCDFCYLSDFLQALTDDYGNSNSDLLGCDCGSEFLHFCAFSFLPFLPFLILLVTYNL
jgi:hypothetical protein